MSCPFPVMVMPDGRQSGFFLARFLYSGTARYPTAVLTSFLKALNVFTEKEEICKERSSFIYKKYRERERAILFNKKHSDPKLRILSEIVGTIFAFYMVSGCQQIKWFLLKF